MSVALRPACDLKPGDSVLASTFGVHTVETITALPGGVLRVDLTEAIVMFADPTYAVTTLEAAA